MIKAIVFAAVVSLAAGTTGAKAWYGDNPGADSPGQDQRPDFYTGGLQPGQPLVADFPTWGRGYYGGIQRFRY